jgi:mono/diheme cytochrome c family protein
MVNVYIRTAVVAAVSIAAASAQQKLPDAPGRDTLQKLCGSCHSANIVLGRGLTRQEWGEVVASMVSRGAKGTQPEFAQVVDYLAHNLPPTPSASSGPGTRRRCGGGGFTVGPNDKQIVDAAAADRGRSIYNVQCLSCHGPEARGNNNGPDLVRSVLVLHDRYGSALGPFLLAGHPGKNQSAALTHAQIEELSHFLHQQLNNTLRSGPYSKVLNVLTGDPKAGAAYFNGAGGCKECHSPSRDLAGIASRYDPPTLQQRFLFPEVVSFIPGSPGVAKPVTITVTAPGQAPVTGSIEKIDDFDVSLRDSAGDYHSWKRTPDLQIERHNPYAAHITLLDSYTDQNIHDVVAYLETLK